MAPQPQVRDPCDGGTTERNDCEDRGFASAPTRTDSEENQSQIDAPGDERSGDQAVIDPTRTVRDVGPDDDNDDACRNEDEPRAERPGDQLVQHAERRKQPVEGARLLALELAF